MGEIRKPFQGIFNVVHFNWHLYLLSGIVVILLFAVSFYFHYPIKGYISLLLLCVLTSILLSLLVSFYVYDISSLYKLAWLNDAPKNAALQILNIHAGFDETSVLLRNKYKHAKLVVFDFYDPLTHTEISIKRARKAYPSFPDTQRVTTSALPLQHNSVDKIFAIFAAHEIRNTQERVIFFRELKRVLNTSGEIVVTEHLRDVNNFIAYNIGCFHFYSKKRWLHTFSSAGLQVVKTIKVTPFVTTFILKKNGNAS